MTSRRNGASDEARAQWRSLSEALEGTAAKRRRRAPLFEWRDRDDPAARAVVRELHDAVGRGEERVVLAAPDVEPRAETAAALADENRSAAHDVAVVALDAEALRVA